MTAGPFNVEQTLQKDPYQHLLKSARAIPWKLDLSNWCFSYVGSQAKDLLGYPINDWYQPDFWLDKIHPDDKTWAPTFCRQAAARHEDHSFEYRMIKSDGSVIWVRDDVTVINDDNGPAALQGFMFDITERKQAESVINSLAKSGSIHNTDDFFRDCVKNLSEVYGSRYAFIGILNEDKQAVTTFTVWANGQHVDNFTYELEGTPCKDVLDLSKELVPRDAAKEYPEDQMLVDMGIDSYYGAPLISSENTLLGLVSVMDNKPMELTQWSAPILGVFASRIAVELERKFATEALGKINDTLEQRVERRTEELAVAYKEMESFSYSVSHDLRAPLRSIDGFGLALLEDYSEQFDDTALNYLHRIRHNTQYMGELIDDLLNLSRIIRHSLQNEMVSLPEMATEVFNTYQQNDRERKVTFINNNIHSVRGDPTLLRVLFENLLGNAFKYTSKEPKPVIEFNSITENNEFVHFIRDNGAGFNMEYINKLFTPFQRLHDQREFKGNGIGLATAKRIVQRHDGKIWADAEPDKGATFYFTLGAKN